MGLLNCPECGKKFSSHAEMYPECACPTSMAESWKGQLPLQAASSSAIAGNQPSSAFMNEGTVTPPAQSSSHSALELDLGNGVSMRFALIPAGEFLMGSPASEQGRIENEVQHKVTISKPFFMGIYPVTQRQYMAVMGENLSIFRDNYDLAVEGMDSNGENSNAFIDSDELPVENVDWDDAAEFCRRVSAKSGRRARLPTEAEWEYACRAGTTTPFAFGNTISKYQANHSQEYDETTPVGKFTENGWGLFDMHGNVWEWCLDWYGEYPKGKVTDPTGPLTGQFRVLRGGSWSNEPKDCRSAFRYEDAPGYCDCDIGFRVSLDFRF